MAGMGTTHAITITATTTMAITAETVIDSTTMGLVRTGTVGDSGMVINARPIDAIDNAV